MDAYLVDRKAVQVENLFLDLLKRFRADPDAGGGPPHYESKVNFSHIMLFSDPLQSAIYDEYLRFEASLRNACKRFVMEQKPSSRTKLCCRLIRSRYLSD